MAEIRGGTWATEEEAPSLLSCARLWSAVITRPETEPRPLTGFCRTMSVTFVCCVETAKGTGSC